MKVKDLAAIVTGGGTGIGFATAKLLKDAGARVTILGRRRDIIDKAGQEIGALAIACCDISDEESVTAAFRQAYEAHGPVRILVNNAAVTQMKINKMILVQIVFVWVAKSAQKRVLPALLNLKSRWLEVSRSGTWILISAFLIFNDHGGCGICIAVCPWSRPNVRPKMLEKMLKKKAEREMVAD